MRGEDQAAMASDAHKNLGFMQLVIICGFSIFYAFYLLSFFGFFLFFPNSYSFTEGHISQVMYFLGTLAGSLFLLALYRKNNSTDFKHDLRFHIISILLASALPACVILESLGKSIPLPIIYISSFVCGLVIAAGFAFWEDLSLRGYLKRSMFSHSIIFAAGSLLFLIIIAGLSYIGVAVACEIALIVNILLVAFIEPRCEYSKSTSLEKTIKFFKNTRHLDVVTYIINAAFGFAFILLYEIGNVYLLCIMAIAVIIDLAISLFIGRNRVMPFVGSIRITIAFVGVALILYVCPGITIKIIGLGIIVVFWFIWRTVNGGAAAEMATRNKFPILYVGVRAKLSSNIGFTIGLVLGVCIAGFGYSNFAYVYAALGLVAAFILGALFLLPFENESDAPGLKTLNLIDIEKNPQHAGAQMASTEEKCKRIVSVYKLSSREAEVLSFVVKGRNAKHIAQKLYITESTTKTHLTNIYRKLGVHSQQELLDLLDLI